ncbi:MAG: tRNA pseudouridine(38-40) synthase TruA [Candidatus Binataceae bacterium]
MQIKLVLEYDGTNYSGWQIQHGQDSIQARVEAALELIFAAPVRIYAAGRTDAGVHARGQVATLRPPRPFDADELRRALNATLPDDIAVLDAADVSDDFDPRRDARIRVYEYRVLNRITRSVFEHRFAWLVRDRLDLDALNAAAREFIGEHDFAAFRTLGTDVKSTVRRVDVSEWRRENETLTYRIEATGFLRHQVRTMVGAMIEVGRLRLTPTDIRALLASRDRARAPAAAPSSGLFLIEIRY